MFLKCFDTISQNVKILIVLSFSYKMLFFFFFWLRISHKMFLKIAPKPMSLGHPLTFP